MADALFLDKHPGWSWADLMSAPDTVIAVIRFIDRKKQ